MTTPNEPVSATYSRVLNHADKLFESLEELATSGGLRALRGQMKRTSVDKAATLLRSVRMAIDEQLKDLDRHDQTATKRKAKPE